MSTISTSDALQATITISVACTYFPVLIGAWKIMTRFGTVSSKTLFIPIAFFPLWIPLQHFVLGGMSTIDVMALRETVDWISAAITCLLFIIPAISFLLVSKHISKSGDSPKPAPTEHALK